MWLDKYTNYTVNNKDQDVYKISLHGLLSRPCEDIFKKTIHSNEIKENYTKSHKITRDCANLITNLPNLQYRGMVKSDPVINARQITPINYEVTTLYK